MKAEETISRIVSGERIEKRDFYDPETRKEVESRFAMNKVYVGDSVNVFDACSFFRPEFLILLRDLGMKPKIHQQLYDHPLADALLEEDLDKAEILFDCGYSLFRDFGPAIYTFGDKRYSVGEEDHGDIFDALFIKGKFRSLKFALERSEYVHLRRRDSERFGVYTIAYMSFISSLAHFICTKAIENLINQFLE